MIGDEKEVYFTKCHQCEHWELPEDEDPCHECLQTPSNEDSHTPIHFKDSQK